LDEAIIEFKEAIRIDPEDAFYHNNLGVAFFLKGLLPEAIKEYLDFSSTVASG